jgi:hypothetical protein
VKLFFLSVILSAAALAQSAGTLRGVVSDETGAVIPGAKVTVTGPRGVVKTTTAGVDGSYVFTGLPPGKYSVQAASPGLEQFQPATADVGPGVKTLNIQLRVAVETQQVTVQETTAPAVSTDPASNAGQLTLKTEDLQSLSDDPDDLQQDLQALAGPSAGPNGGQIYIDGFTDGRMPPKESIREIRINSNPFSAQYDHLGFGRIEIFTKPGSDKFRGTAFFNISDGTFNARNPYLTSGVTPPFQTREFGGNVSGPLGRKASFFLDAERREIDDDAIINAQIVNPDTFRIQPYSTFLQTPQRRTTVSPRLDYQLTTNHTLTLRYTYLLNNLTGNGVGNFNLESRGYNYRYRQQTVQATETAVVNVHTINETRFQYRREDTFDFGNNSVPALNVLQAFNGGGAQIGNAYDKENHYELQNYTSVNSGKHAWKFGLRARSVTVGNFSPMNFGGTFSFASGPGPELDANNNPVLDAGGNPIILPFLSSIERYRRTLLFQQQGLPAARIRQLGGGASQFSMAAGNPLAQVTQTDLSPFIQDDWQLRPNLTLSLGLRWEYQTNMHDFRDWAPRIGFAWAPGSPSNLRPKMVFRGGFGMFYSRFSQTYVLNAKRYNGLTQTQYIAINPDFFPNVPPLSALQQQVTAITTIDANLRAPYVMQTAIGVERQLPLNSTLAVTYTNTRGVHLLASRDINAPLPGTYIPGVPGSGVRPFGNVGEIDQYETGGILNQNQLIVNVNTRASRNLSLFTGYVLNYARSDTDGGFPADQYNRAQDYGRSSLDVRNRFFMGGSYTTRWNFRLSPFIIARSGAPFNIYESRDLYGDTLLNTSRPAFAADPNAPGVIVTPYGILDPNPKPGERLIPRNLGNGPAFFTLNLRLSRTFGFGGERNAPGVAAPGGGLSGGGHGRGGPGGVGHFGGRGFGGGDALTSRRFNLILSVQARNLLNTNNAGPVIGDITSPYFGTSNQLAGGFGAVSSPANNRRIEFQLRLSF